jgi:threonylcarbamoyladenosine tRNA methylthiotransferase MtaB
MKAALYTLGCKVNQSEGEAIASTLKQKGVYLVAIRERADMYIINTCTVTSKSDQKARRIIRYCVKKNGTALIIITGCYAELEPVYLSGIAENAIVIPQHRKERLLDILKNISIPDFLLCNGEEKKEYIKSFLTQYASNTPRDHFRFFTDDVFLHTRAFLKIQDGCSYRCRYCRVPLARGGSVSLSPEEVMRRICRLEERGYREIILTGINIADYRYSDETLVTLLRRMLAVLQSARIRLTSLEPERVDNELAGVLSDKRICAHFHIPVQSGSNKILKAMGRRYDAERIRKCVEFLRQARPDCFLGADVIVGFPGERDEDFELSRALLDSCEFSALHVFPFSPRSGTKAFFSDDRVRDSIKRRRVDELLALSKKLTHAYISRFRGKRVEAILEKKMEKRDNGTMTFQGLSGNYIRLAVETIPVEQAKRGNLVQAVIEQTGYPVKARFYAG